MTAAPDVTAKRRDAASIGATDRFHSDRSRWTAVVEHDAAADGIFFYAVATTGVFCRPSCGARRPRRENVTFHDTVDAAKQAGFRPCKRCWPDRTAAGARIVGANVSAIRFATAACSLGMVLVAATPRGVCAILFGENAAALGDDLRLRFPTDVLAPDSRSLAPVIREIVRAIDAPHDGLDIALDVRGTVFQQRVWRELQNIPLGSTATYANVAERLGTPRATRAVARACAANPIAVAIPCHRVVRSDGKLAGYRWGVERKRALLTREAAA